MEICFYFFLSLLFWVFLSLSLCFFIFLNLCFCVEVDVEVNLHVICVFFGLIILIVSFLEVIGLMVWGLGFVGLGKREEWDRDGGWTGGWT